MKKTNINYNREYFNGNGGLTEKLFCIPFEDKKYFTEEEFENRRFESIVENGINFLNFSTIENCDYVIIPYKWDGRTERSLNIINDAKLNNKKVIALHNDDYEPNSRINIDEGYLFTTTLQKSRRQSNEFSFPAITGDFLPLYNHNFNVIRSIGFCGAITHPIRQTILNMNMPMPQDYIVRKHFWGGELPKEVARIDFFKNMSNNTFILCMRGAGNFSYRFFETMMMGRIPIIINSNQVFPFEEIIDYNSFSIRIPDTQINDITKIINNWLIDKTDDDIERIQRSNRQIWIDYLSPLGWIKNFTKEIER